MRCSHGCVTSMYGVGDDVPIVRPFWPGADYGRVEYPGGCVVVDNPPFSILSKIIRFYQAHGVRFFLFAPRPGIVVREGRESAYHVVLPG
ncbi:ParB-like nuclease [Pseudoscardovia suis]|uniref:ParB-like nuclease n=1 Tax=Pseudoscardovia suis TaxID=987063 RepID=A0A261EYN2_9BIFI|nr:ParB-like nuclease [Pseudoscardovia suis]